MDGKRLATPSAASLVGSVLVRRHHRVARFFAAPAVFCALGVAELRASLRTRVAYPGTCLAHRAVMWRTTQDEIPGHVANLRAILQKSDVFRPGMSAALFQTVLNLVQTCVVAILTAVQALVVFLAQMFVNIAHMLSSYFFGFRFPDRGGTQEETGEVRRAVAVRADQLGMEIGLGLDRDSCAPS